MTTLPPAPIRTDRLDLIPLRVADADAMVGVLADPDLYTFIGGAPPTRGELVERYRAQVAGASADVRETWHNWIIRDRTTGAAIGFVQATIVEPDGVAAGAGTRPDRAGAAGPETAPSAEIAWVVGTAWQGRGYASEAARGLVAWLDDGGVRTIVAHVHPDHHASAAVARRAGLEPTEVFVEGERAWRRVRSAPESGPSEPGRATPR